MFLNYPDIDTQIIAASVRNPIHVTDCALAGADIGIVQEHVMNGFDPVSYTHLKVSNTALPVGELPKILSPTPTRYFKITCC